MLALERMLLESLRQTHIEAATILFLYSLLDYPSDLSYIFGQAVVLAINLKAP
jgi:hypothetical protein